METNSEGVNNEVPTQEQTTKDDNIISSFKPTENTPNDVNRQTRVSLENRQTRVSPETRQTRVSPETRQTRASPENRQTRVSMETNDSNKHKTILHEKGGNDSLSACDVVDIHSANKEDSVITPFLDDVSGSDSSENFEGNDHVYDLDLQQLSRIGSCVSDEEQDTVASRIDLEQINSIKSRTSEDQNHKRKESFEQRLRRTFTIKDAHTSEVTRRIIAIIIKYSLFVFNFLSWVLAVGAIGLGIWMRADKTLLVTSDTEFYLDLPLLTCVGGAVTFVVAFLGCVGALRENLILLRVFFYVLIFILIGEMILAVAVFIIYTVPEARDNFLRSQPEKILYSAIYRYMDDIEVKEWVDRIQSEFKCCGVSKTEEGFRDWKRSPYFNCSSSNKSIYRCAVPKSCCIFEKGDRVNIMCGFEKTNKPLPDVRDYIYTRGCISGFGEWLGKYNDFIIISCLSITIMQFLAVLSAKVMAIRIRKQRARWRPLQSSYSSSAKTMSRI